MRKTGFIQLSREFLDWQWYDDGTAARVFLHLLLTANFEQAQWHGITIERGQRAISLSSLSDETGIPKTNIFRTLKKLEKSGDVKQERNGNSSIITMINYDSFTKGEPLSEQVGNADKTSAEQKRTDYYNNKYNKNYKKNNYNNMRSREKNNHSFDIDELEQSAYERYRKKTVDI